jgi:hypothetical protein
MIAHLDSAGAGIHRLPGNGFILMAGTDEHNELF